jgi:hypothetical protein
LGDTEEYLATGPSIKKAQHAAAAMALEKTKLKHPSPKPKQSSKIGKKKVALCFWCVLLLYFYDTKATFKIF